MFLRSKKPRKSTNLYSVACSISDFSASVDEKIENLQRALFDFSYPIPKDLKSFFEQMFIKKYLTYDFSDKTFEVFKIHLDFMCNEIFQDYKKSLEFFLDDEKYFYDETEKEYSENSSGKNKNISAVLPVGIIDSSTIGTVETADNGTLSENSSQRKNTENSKNLNNRFEKKLKAISEFDDLFNKILNEFQPLFSILM